MALFGITQIMTDGTALNTLSTEIGPARAQNINEITFYIVGDANVVSGAVQIEEAHVKEYAGTWAPVGAAVTVAASTVKSVKASGVGHVYRARISTVMGGTGKVSVFAMGGNI